MVDAAFDAALARDAAPVESPARRALRRLLRRKGAVLGLVVIALFVATAVFAPLIAPYDPAAQGWTANASDAKSQMALLSLDAVDGFMGQNCLTRHGCHQNPGPGATRLMFVEMTKRVNHASGSSNSRVSSAEDVEAVVA